MAKASNLEFRVMAGSNGENIPAGSGNYAIQQGDSLIQCETGGVVWGWTSGQNPATDAAIKCPVPDYGVTRVALNVIDRTNTTAAGVLLAIR